MKRLLILLSVALFGLALAQTTSSESTWLQEKAIVLKTIQAENGFTDLEPVAALVGNARIIGLGEATHGTKEFFQAKHRMLEYLVTTQGFRVFAMEANWASSLALNEYMQTGIGDGKELLQKYAKIMWPWRTQEVLDLIQWLRKYNQTAANKVIFSGFDMQEPVPAVDWLIAYLEKTLPDQATRADELLGCIRFSLGNILNVTRYAAAGIKGFMACAERINTVRRILQNRRSSLETTEYITALQMVRVLEQGNIYYKERFITQDILQAVTIRDAFMAENTSWLEKTTKQKLVIWAHNGHVTFNAKMHFGWKPLGAHLRDMYKDQYKVWGFSFFEGSFYAQMLDGNDPIRTVAAALVGLAANPSIQSVPNPTSDSFEYIFRAAQLPLFMLDLHLAKTPAGAWLKTPRRLQIIGQNLPPFRTPEPDWYSYKAIPTEDFDALIYIDKTTPSTPLQ